MPDGELFEVFEKRKGFPQTGNLFEGKTTRKYGNREILAAEEQKFFKN
jgi:hypothetical protein